MPKDKKLKKIPSLVGVMLVKINSKELTTARYKMQTSNEQYSLFLEILKGNKTYVKLHEISGKKRAHIVEILQPLIILEILKRSPGSGVPGNPIRFYVDKLNLCLMMTSLFEDVEDMDNFPIQENVFNKTLKLITSKSLLFEARNFNDLAKILLREIKGKTQNYELNFV